MTAIIIISHNDKKMTDELCENIIRNTKSPYDLFVIETGSDLDKVSSYMTLWTKDKIRMTRGFNKGIEYALWREKYYDVKYDYFWCIVNDAHFFETDTLTPMINTLEKNKNIGQIHPYIDNSISINQRKSDGEFKKTSFIEIVSPLFTRDAIKLNLFDDRYFYGWGLDYEIPYTLHKNNLYTAISNVSGVIHNAGTTVNKNNDKEIKSREEQFKKSRDNMMQVLIEKHGIDWGDKFLNAIPSDVSNEAFIEWVTKIGCNYSFGE